jgi:hypothetical protein
VVAVLPQASIAEYVLICDLKHPFELVGPSEEFTVGIPQASVALAVPSAALISEADGLHPGGSGVCVTVITGGVRSEVQVTVLEAVAELPQPSTAVKVLTCVTVQLEVVAVASLNERLVTLPQPSVAVADPRAAVISDGKGLQPKATGEYVPVNVGGVRSLVHETVLVIVAELLQLSTAVNVLTCVTVQPEVVANASEEVILVTVPQPSVAVAEPKAAVISPGKGLHPNTTFV